MPLKASAPMRYDRFTVEIQQGVVYYHLFWTCLDPGAGEPSDYDIHVSKAEWDAATTNPLKLTLIQGKLDEKYRPPANLTTLIGTTRTV